jgi:hypothetical protein
MFGTKIVPARTPLIGSLNFRKIPMFQRLRDLSSERAKSSFEVETIVECPVQGRAVIARGPLLRNTAQSAPHLKYAWARPYAWVI